MSMRVEIVIPALNEERSIASVIQAIPTGVVDRVIVVDNGSTDATVECAQRAGAHVVHESRRGYGRACLRGMAEAKETDVVVFLDGDFSDDPGMLPQLIHPILAGDADLVIGSRIAGHCEKGALPIHARWGNRLACGLLRGLFGVSFTDLGPFRAIRKSSLDSLGMQDTGFGLTVEMQAKAAMRGLRCMEIPVRYRKRIGQSKITGTWLGSIRAGSKILFTLFDLWFRQKWGKKIG